MGLVEFLRANKDARKIFGERELKIIEKQLNGINLTQSERNRLSRDIRRKLEFIKEISRFSDEFRLKKAVNVKRLIENAKKIILESKYFPNIKKIYLFGSFAVNELTFRSDIDIAVEFDSIAQKDATDFRIFVGGRVGERIDIQVYNALPEKIKKEIDLKGKVIYERKIK